MLNPKLLTLALLLNLLHVAVAQLDWAAVTNSNALQSGDGTFYGADQDDQGTCSYGSNFADTNDLPWSTGTAMTVAMNNDQFDNTAACGMCVQLRGTGAGLGTTPIPATWTMALVTNRCPECAFGSIDLAASGDGRWNIQWYAVPCDVGSTPLYYSIVVSSYYWFSMVVSNTRVPITGVSAKIGGSWLPLKRSSNNQWAYYNTNGPWQSSFPMPIQVTSITGETVQDTVTGPSGNSGAVQFSASGTGSTSAVPATQGPGSGSTASPPVSSVPASPPVSYTPGSASPPVSMPSPPIAAPQSPPPTPTSPPANLPSGSFYIENYQQCGGDSIMCNNAPYTSAPCQDAAWSAAVCRTSGFTCTRASAQLWSCLPGGQGSTTPPASPTSPTSPPTPPTSPTSPPPAPASPSTTPPAGINAISSAYAINAAQSPPPAVQSPPAPDTQYTASPPPTPVQASNPPPATTSSTTPPATVQTSSISSSPTETAAASTSTFSVAITAGGQCGGTSNCDPPGQQGDKVTCANAPWSGATCPSGYSCTANPGPLVWTCTSASSATGRRLLQAR